MREVAWWIAYQRIHEIEWRLGQLERERMDHWLLLLETLTEAKTLEEQ